MLAGRNVGSIFRVKAILTRTLGAQKVTDDPPVMASEDFGLFGLDGHKIPTVMFMLGAADPAKFAAAQSTGKQLPAHHNSRFEPSPEQTLRTGVQSLTSTAISLLSN
jgi:metal-dependent amidase/aminoacylase/carboxypeptidase family protein